MTTPNNCSPDGGLPDAPCSDFSAQYELAKSAVHHVLNAIADDPRKFWLMGNGTGSWEKLTIAAAAIWNRPVEEIRKEYQPREDQYRNYCALKENEERLVTYCRDNDVTIPRDDDDED